MNKYVRKLLNMKNNNKVGKKNIPHCRNILKSNVAKLIHLTHPCMTDHSLGTLMKGGGVNLYSYYCCSFVL